MLAPLVVKLLVACGTLLLLSGAWELVRGGLAGARAGDHALPDDPWAERAEGPWPGFGERWEPFNERYRSFRASRGRQHRRDPYP